MLIIDSQSSMFTHHSKHYSDTRQDRILEDCYFNSTKYFVLSVVFFFYPDLDIKHYDNI